MKLKEYLETRKISKNIFKVIALVLFMTIFNSLSYAYFTSTIEGEGKEIVLSTSDISIKFEDNEAIKKTGLTPGERIIKKFSVTNNSEGKVEYKINWEYLINNFVNREYLTYKITSTNGGGTLTEVQLPDSEEHINIISSVTINPGVTQEYTMSINYKNSSSINQDADKNKSLIGKLEITDMSGNSILPETSTGSIEGVELEQTLYGMTVKEIMNEIYPVGSIYTSTESANPSEKFGGVWERYGKGKTLVGVDEDDSSFNVSSKTGGSKSTTLTVDNLPKHTHSIPSLTGSTSTNGKHIHPYNLNHATTGTSWGYPPLSGPEKDLYNYETASGLIGSAGDHSHTITTDASTTGSSGSGSSFSNLQPYITVYMWKRIS